MNNKIKRPCETLSVEELQAELKRLKDNLCDLEDTHSFTFGKTTVHIGAEQAQSMQEEYEEESRSYKEQIAAIEVLLRTRGQ
jgi:ribosomal protein L29